ncbi:DUF2309 domain-containing protein [Proteobacteria bacterium 005FR1]|nr:DUF2309 domain-containing protein [Proteobacteria bacterium 005FR1]
MSTLAPERNALTATSLKRQAAVRNACGLIAPVWPLDRFIAVNPWWNHVNQPFEDVAARLSARGGVTPLMKGEYFRQRWEGGSIREAHLQQACDERREGTLDLPALLAALEQKSPTARTLLCSDWIDRQRDPVHQMPWNNEIVDQISQFCGAYFDRGQASWTPPREKGLYASWQANASRDRGIGLLMGEPGVHRQIAALPVRAGDLLEAALDELAVPETALVSYAHSLLLNINGWASWCAYLAWQNRLEKKAEGDELFELLCIRLAWELVLCRHYGSAFSRSEFTAALVDERSRIEAHQQHQAALLIWQRAAELAYQQDLLHKIRKHSEAHSETGIGEPLLQAVFCIDVRSEVYRRHLESLDSRIQTLGFAGFFGLPVACQAGGSDYHRPQLPGLLAPAYRVSEPNRSVNGKRWALGESWRSFAKASPSAFTFVESAGLAYLLKLVKSSYRGELLADPLSPSAPPELSHLDSGDALSVAEKAQLADGILTGMGLTKTFAPVVLLVGHGSHSRNNPHRASLDCGACGGQTGEVNSRAVAHLLNDPAVRSALAEQNIVIPEQTRFVAALHDTTTDEIRLFDNKLAKKEWNGGLGKTVETWLREASGLTARERCAKIDDGEARAVDLQKRGRDWSQVRPEWGLANNASFIIAPRRLTRTLNLDGRSFLHDYEAGEDLDFKVLEQIITAPMIVTHWINFQYYASVVDNRHYGSGNKVLHNVVGGNIGVFEGNGGDLRTGLPMQSLHNGSEWMHQPFRLSVVVAAPRKAIEDIVARHEAVRQLVNNEWLYLFQLDHAQQGRNSARFFKGEWIETEEPGEGVK